MTQTSPRLSIASPQHEKGKAGLWFGESEHSIWFGQSLRSSSRNRNKFTSRWQTRTVSTSKIRVFTWPPFALLRSQAEEAKDFKEKTLERAGDAQMLTTQPVPSEFHTFLDLPRILFIYFFPKQCGHTRGSYGSRKAADA